MPQQSTANTIPQQAAKIISQRAPNFTPQIGIVLGSGMGQFAAEIADPVIINYQDIPGMKSCLVSGHHGLLSLGTIKGKTVACFQGRNHLYEGHNAETIQTPIRLLKLLGANLVILLCAVGSLNPEMPPGSLVILNDHINLQFSNPLVGTNDETFGPRFPSLEEAYDPQLRQQLAAVARQLHIPTREGVYVGVLGPSFETPAEIRAFRILGADVVGMSTIPEVIVARHCGLKVLALAVVTNLAVGLSKEKVVHQTTLDTAAKAVHDVSRLLVAFLENYR